MLRIVVCEDEAVIRMDLSEMLTEEGYQVVGQASDGEAAVATIERTGPDLALVDVAMPRLDGLEVTRRVAERTAVVVVTAFGQRDTIERATAAGAMGYLVKPVTRVDLVPAIEVAAARFATMADLREEVGDLQERLAARRDIERAKGVIGTRLGLSEDAAYRWLRQAAMDARRPLAEVARDVLGTGSPT